MLHLKHPNEQADRFPQRAADWSVRLLGSWGAVIGQSAVYAAWVAINSAALCRLWGGKPWDPFPFLILNLTLSLASALTNPVLMMGQARSADRDRRAAEVDFEVNRHNAALLEELRQELAEIRERLG